jgi:hypothetical protein
MFGQITSRFGKLATAHLGPLDLPVIEQFGAHDSPVSNSGDENPAARQPTPVLVCSRGLLGRPDQNTGFEMMDNRASHAPRSASGPTGLEHLEECSAVQPTEILIAESCAGPSSEPHEAQAVASCVAHCAQNLAPSRLA